MKLMYEIETRESECIISESLNEATGEKSKKYKIKGIFSTIGEKNKNGRIYPRNIWEKEVFTYQNTIKSGSLNSLCEWQHPPRTSVDPMEAVAKIEKLYIEGKYVMGEAVLLDNPKANQLKTLIDNGIKLAVSSRGVGKVNEGIVRDFKLITYDILSSETQSDYNAEMFGLVEGILQDKEFILTESGDIKEVAPKKAKITDQFTNEEISKGLREKFKNLFNSL